MKRTPDKSAPDKRTLDEIWAFVTTDEAGGEEIVRVGLHHVHLIAGDLAGARMLAPTAQSWSDRTAKSFRLIKFAGRQDVTELLR